MTIKDKHEKAITEAIRDAGGDGFKVSVASDPEGNGYNSIKFDSSIYADTKENEIVLGVWEHRDGGELFKSE